MEENQIITKTSERDLFNKILFRILLITTFLVPIFFLPGTLISTQFSTSLIFSLGVIVSVIIYIVTNLFYGSFDWPVRSKYILGSMAVVPLVYLLAGIANGFSRMSFFGYTFDINTVGFILLSFAYLFLVSILFQEKNRIFYSYFTFLVSFIILSLFIIIRLIFGADFLSFGIFTSLTSTPIGSWNNVGIFFGIGTLLSLFTFEMADVSKFMKILISTALLLSLFFLALVNFNVIWIIIAICSFLFIVYKIFSSTSAVLDLENNSFKNRLSRVRPYPLVVFVVSVVFIFGSTSLGSFISNTFRVSNTEIQPSFSATMEVARNTINEHPLFGSGPNTFTKEWLKWKPNNVANTSLWNVDFANGSGLIPTFLIATGIIGILSWLIFFIFYVYLGVKSIFVRLEDSFIRYLLTSSFFVSLYLWIMIFVFVPSVAIFILTFFFSGLFFASVYLSGLIKVEKRKFSDNPKLGFISSLIFVAFLVAGISLGYGLFKSSKSLWYFQKSSKALNSSGDINASENLMMNAIEVVPNDIYYRSLSEIELLKLNAVVSQDTSKVKVEDIQKQFNDVLTDAITAAKSAQNKDSLNYLNWMALGRVYETISAPELKIDGAYESAQFAYTEALKHNPKNPGIFLFLARLATVRKDWNQARIYAEEATKMKNDYLDAYFLLSQIEVADNNINGAIKSVTSASVIDPTNPAIFFQLGLLEYNIKNFDKAIEALEKAITIAPDYANAKYFLGLSYESIGDRAEAIKQFEDILITNPDSREVIDIISNLKTGKPIFTNTANSKPEKAKSLPVKEAKQ